MWIWKVWLQLSENASFEVCVVWFNLCLPWASPLSYIAMRVVFFSLIDYIDAYVLNRLIYLRSKGKLVINPEFGGGRGEEIMTLLTAWIKILLRASPACQWMQMSFIFLSVWVCVGGGGDRGESQRYHHCCNAELRQPPVHHLLPNSFCFSKTTDISQPPVAHLAKILMHPKVQMAATIQNRESEIKSKQAEQKNKIWVWTCH